MTINAITNDGKVVLVNLGQEKEVKISFSIFGNNHELIKTCKNFSVPSWLYDSLTLEDVAEAIAINLPEVKNVSSEKQVSIWDPSRYFEEKLDKIDTEINQETTRDDTVLYTADVPENVVEHLIDTGWILDISDATELTFSKPVWLKVMSGYMVIDGEKLIPDIYRRDTKSDFVTIETSSQLMVTLILLDE